FYGPYFTNQIIKEALHPYPADLRIVTKVGALRDDRGAWLPAYSQVELVTAVHSNLKNLGLDALDVVNLRIHGHDAADQRNDDSVAERFSGLAKLQRQGLIRHLGLSNATAAQLAEAQAIAPVVTVQNLYNVVNRQDDALVALCSQQNIAYTPYFPLG